MLITGAAGTSCECPAFISAFPRPKFQQIPEFLVCGLILRYEWSYENKITNPDSWQVAIIAAVTGNQVNKMKS